jgi:5-methylcytosine-specific restriction endonuclease McrA
MKTCTNCNLTKIPSEFYKVSIKRNRDGLDSWCKNCVRAYKRRDRAANPQKHIDRQKEWRKGNKDHLDAYHAKYREDNREIVRKRNREYAKYNKSKKNSLNAKRRAAKLNATPSWLSEDDLKWIKWYYEQAQRLTEYTGIKHHVDHVHPLRGGEVCGLHVPWNLQVLTQDENLKKGIHLRD